MTQMESENSDKEVQIEVPRCLKAASYLEKSCSDVILGPSFKQPKIYMHNEKSTIFPDRRTMIENVFTLYTYQSTRNKIVGKSSE